MMKVLQGLLLLLSSLLKVCRSQHWAVDLPRQVLGLDASCLLLPCSFSLPPEFEPQLDSSCRAVWRRGSWSRTQVYDSGAATNLLQGNLTGNLLERDCSTVFYNLPLNHYDDYYFRLECEPLKFNFYDSVFVKIQDALPRPTVSPSSVEVEEGSHVTLNCTAVAPCPMEAPVLSWSPVLGQALPLTLERGFLTSVVGFSASHLHNGVTVTCSALYRRNTIHTELLYETTLTLRVLYRPRNVSVLSPGPVTEGRPVTLSCVADANPAVDSFSWYSLDGDQVTALVSTQNFTTEASEGNSQFFCQVSNQCGQQNSSVAHVDVQFAPKNTSVLVEPPGALVEGSSVSLLCVTRSHPPVSHFAWFRDGLEQTEVRGAVLVWESAHHSHSGTYHCEATNRLGQDSSDSVQLDIQYPPKTTVVSSAPSGPVEEGSSVALSCSTDANPASVNFTWYRVSGRLRALVGHGSTYSFNVSRLSEEQFYCGAVNAHGADFSQTMSINVTFPPEILSSSRCVKTLSQIRCSCDSLGNPAPSLQWELSGERVNHSALTPIAEESQSSVQTRSTITLHALDRGLPSLLCHSANALGADTLVFDVSSSHSQLGFHTLSLLVGSAAGAMGTCVLCLPLLIFFCRKRKTSHLPYRKVREPSDAAVGPEVRSPLSPVNGALKGPQDEDDLEPVYHSCETAGLESKTIEDSHQLSDHEISGEIRCDKTEEVNGINGQVNEDASEQ